MSYDPRNYWDDVAREISSRNSGSAVAGYDSPLDRYARDKVMEHFCAIDVSGKDVMEIGSGSGLNLRLLDERRPRSITAVDVSENMLSLAKERMRTAVSPTRFLHIDGRSIPLKDSSIDVIFTVTVLQHNSDLPALQSLMGEMARLARQRICLFEDTSPLERGTPEYMMRPPSFYREFFESRGFHLVESRYISIFFTQKLFSLFNRLTGLYRKKEGAATSPLAKLLYYPFLPLTSLLDRIFVRTEGNTMMIFERIRPS